MFSFLRRGWRPLPHRTFSGNPQELPPGAHSHNCTTPGCKSYVVCFRGPDCPVAPEACASCDHDRMVAWADAEEARRG